MSRSVRVMTMDDVNTDEDLKRFLKTMRAMANALSMVFALAASQLGAMLKDYDKRAGKNRRGRISRPLALAAGAMVLVSKLLTLAARRFDQEYHNEIVASGRRRREARRFRFGG
jgi:hypothetical protein